MTTLTAPPTTETRVEARPGFGAVLRAEGIKLRTVRSTGWTMTALVVLGVGLTVLICALNAEWLASGDADESPGSFITWGMMLAPIAAVVLGALVATTEYSTGMIRSTFAAMPHRGAVLAAKALLVSALLFVVGTGSALLGYLGGNWFLDREGVGMALEGDVLRAMYGSGLYLAGVGVFTLAVGFLVRHTAAAVSIVLALFLVVGNMVNLVPGEVGEWLVKLMPGNAGSVIASPTPFNPNLLDAWPGLAVFAAEIAVLMGLAWYALRRRDA